MSGKPAHIADLDMERLMALWFNDELTKAEIAKEMGVSASWLSSHRERLGLPERSRRPAKTMIDPTPAEIAERCAEIREARLAKKAEIDNGDATPYRTECLAWDGYSFAVRTA